MRILDLGCGTGLSIKKVGLKLAADDIVVGVDIDETKLISARSGCPARHFICARGESLPLASTTFEFVLCNVSLPYMDIPEALGEASRVLVAGGRLYLKVHPLGFTMKEILNALPKPIATIFRLYVIANGFIFHLTGRTASLLGRRTESFQTRRGLRIALARAQFTDLVFSRPEGKLIVQARKTQAAAIVTPRAA